MNSLAFPASFMQLLHEDATLSSDCRLRDIRKVCEIFPRSAWIASPYQLSQAFCGLEKRTAQGFRSAQEKGLPHLAVRAKDPNLFVLRDQ
jgi:hypothetical protein